MQRIKRSGLSTSTICLSLFLVSCTPLTIPKVDDVYRRTLFFEIIDQDDEVIVIDKRSAHCRIQRYKHSLIHIGPVGRGEDRPIEECISIIGYDAQDYGKLAAAKKLFRMKAVMSGVKESE